MTLHSLTENSLAVLNHKILEANSQVQNVKLGGHPTCLSINRLWHELCDMLRRLVGTTALDIMIVQFRNEKVSNHGSIPITIDCNVVAFIVFEEGFHQPIKRTKQCKLLNREPTTNRRAPLPGTDTGSLRSRTRRRYPHRDRSHHINATTNQKAPSRNTGGSNHSHLTLNTDTKSCLPIGRAISHPEVPIGRRKLSFM
ncbi:uncharacterized protein TNCV_3986021 [Trichonephila clavipes]|nr:uncharacterized protein TNCV_3986021 [Trichonephila clavipes]